MTMAVHLCECGCGMPTPIAKRTRTAIGHIKGQPTRFLSGHNGRYHGHSHSPTWEAWKAMRQRAISHNPRTQPYYGDRGIVVCERWQSFLLFLEDMGEKPEGLTLDRIDNDGSYEPGNCRWATPSEQRRNQRRKTHCKRGHPLDGDNLYTAPSGRRQCRACARIRRLATRA